MASFGVNAPESEAGGGLTKKPGRRVRLPERARRDECADADPGQHAPSAKTRAPSPATGAAGEGVKSRPGGRSTGPSRGRAGVPRPSAGPGRAAVKEPRLLDPRLLMDP